MYRGISAISMLLSLWGRLNDAVMASPGYGKRVSTQNRPGERFLGKTRPLAEAQLRPRPFLLRTRLNTAFFEAIFPSCPSGPANGRAFPSRELALGPPNRGKQGQWSSFFPGVAPTAGSRRRLFA